MRKINTRHFNVATRSTPREVNRQIVLNLIREHQPISRADLARLMRVNRGALTAIVRELVASGVVYEEGIASDRTGPGRRPTLLRISTRNRIVLAVDVRSARTRIALVDFAGSVLATTSLATPANPDDLLSRIEERGARLLRERSLEATCEGVGLVIPGMVDRRTGRILYAPRLRWRNVDLRDALQERLRLPVYIESAPIACALARLWVAPDETRGVHSFAYVSISDGVGVGLVVNGEPLRGDAHTAGEFGHVSYDPSGPRCICGKTGCWETMVGNAATVARYERALRERTGAVPHETGAGARRPPTVEEIVRRARRGDDAAIAALTETAEHIGGGLAAVVSVFNPGRIYVGGEITAAWDLLEQPIRTALVEGTLTEASHATPVVPDASPAGHRLLGALALVAAPAFAAPTFG